MAVLAALWGSRLPGYSIPVTESWMGVTYDPSHRIYDNVSAHVCDAAGTVTHLVLVYGGLSASAVSINYVVCNDSNVILRQGTSTGWTTSSSGAELLHSDVSGQSVWAVRIPLATELTVNPGDILKAGCQFSAGSTQRIRRIDASPATNNIVFFSNASGLVPLGTAWPDPVTGGTANNRRILCWFEGNPADAATLSFLDGPSVIARTVNSYTIGGLMSAQGDVFGVAVLAADTAPTTPQQIELGNNGANNPARGSGNSATDVNGSFSFQITGVNLADNPTHDLHIVGRAPE